MAVQYQDEASAADGISPTGVIAGTTASTIAASVEAGVRSGALPAGAPLPPVRRLAADLGARGVVFHVLWSGPFSENPPKILMLAALAARLLDFDAIVCPERTSLLLRRMGVSTAASTATGR